MSIVGCDYSSRFIDLVALDEDTDAATWHRFELTGQDAFERTRSVREALRWHHPYWLWDDVLAVGIEEPRGYGAGSLYRIQGAILACLPNGLLVQPWVPSSWRKTVGLAGNASKDDVAAFAIDNWLQPLNAPMILPQQDAYDAYCIALATRTMIEVGEAA